MKPRNFFYRYTKRYKYIKTSLDSYTAGFKFFLLKYKKTERFTKYCKK